MKGKELNRAAFEREVQSKATGDGSQRDVSRSVPMRWRAAFQLSAQRWWSD